LTLQSSWPWAALPCPFRATDRLNRVIYAGERITLERRGKPAAAIVSLEDLALLEAIEGGEDIKGAKRAVAEMKRKGEKPIPLAKVKKSLGL